MICDKNTKLVIFSALAGCTKNKLKTTAANAKNKTDKSFFITISYLFLDKQANNQ